MITNPQIDEIIPLISTVELRDSYTQGHSQRVANYGKNFAQFLNLPKNIIENVYIAGLLHDLGKIGIPDNILLKPTKLEDNEYELIKLHSEISGKIVEKIPNFSYLSKIVKYHHENWDGSGYPDGLKGEDIPLESRILSICDVFDALTTKRVYRTSMSLEYTIDLMEKMENKFDPKLFYEFKRFIKKFGIIKKEDTKFIAYPELEKLRNNFFFTDHLTTLLNREGILAVLKKCADYKYKVIFLEINIKNFKEYNKIYGLKKGDELLKEISAILKNGFKAITLPEEPKYKNLYLARVHADRFALLYIAQRSLYLEYKLKEISEFFKKKYIITLEYSFFIKNKELPKNIEKELGYLL